MNIFAAGFACRNPECKGNIEQEWNEYRRQNRIPDFRLSPAIEVKDDPEEDDIHLKPQTRT